MRKELLCGVAAIAITTALSGPAAAADMPVKGAAPAPSIYAPNWSGPYLGLHAGWGQSKFEGADSAGTPLFYPKPKGFLLGFHAGYNWQFSPNWLFGIEGDITATPGWHSTLQTSPGASSLVSGHVGSLASIRARLGWTFDRTLIYATGGVAWATWNGFGASTPQEFGPQRITAGAVAGGGIEWKYNPNLSFRAEGLHYWIKETTFDPGSTGFSGIKNVTVFRLGATWHFDGGGAWGKGPVATRY